MSTKIKGMTLFMYIAGRRKPIVKATTTEKLITVMNALEQNPIAGKAKIEKLVYTDGVYVGVFNQGNFDFDEPNEYFSVTGKEMLRKLEQLSDNGLGFLESEIITPNIYTTEYSEIYDAALSEMSGSLESGIVNERAIAGAIKRAFKQFGIVYEAAADMVGELKRDIGTFVKSAMPAQMQSNSLHSVSLYQACKESQKDFQALQQTAQDSYQAIVDELDSCDSKEC